jgi:flagellar basal-body rod protein FlgG
MARAVNVSATGMVLMQQYLDVVAHNMANANTGAFKSFVVNAKDLAYQTEIRPGVEVAVGQERLPAGVQFGLGAAVSSITRNLKQGELKPTPGNNLNIALSGHGFLQVNLEDGTTAYTRNGALQINQDGELVDLNGNTIAPGITIPDDAIDITITEGGVVEVGIQGQVEPEVLGTIEIARFSNPSGLEAIGNNLFLETAASGEPTVGNPNEDGFASIKQYFLEESNANTIELVANMVKVQRVYEQNAKCMETAAQMLKTATDIRA